MGRRVGEAGTVVGNRERGSVGIFFNIFFNNILISTRIGFYLQGVARLVAPLAPVRQIASAVPVHVARQGDHAGGPSQRCAASAMTWRSLSRHMH